MPKRGSPPRRTPLPRSTKPIRRARKRIKARKADPAKRRWAKHRNPEFIAWIKTLPCCITVRRTGDWIFPEIGGWVAGFHYSGLALSNTAWGICVVVDPAHIKCRSTGGDDVGNVVPLAHHLHDELHAHGIKTFQRKYGVDPAKLAAEYGGRWRQEQGA